MHAVGGEAGPAVQERQARGGAAKRGPGQEAEAERGADDAHALGAVLAARHVGDGSDRDREVFRHDAAEDRPRRKSVKEPLKTSTR